MTRRLRARSILPGLCILACCCAPAAAAPTQTGIDLPRVVGRLHPLVVHFPIALLAAGMLFELFALAFRRERAKPTNAGLACVVVGAIGAGVAAWAGWMNAEAEPHGRGVADLIEVHRWLGIATVVLALVALVAGAIGKTGRARAMTAAYRVALVLAAGVVAVAGHWGGSIVYGEDYLSEVLFPRPAETVPDSGLRLAQSEPQPPLGVDFTTQIAPIFAEHCFECHGPTRGKGGLRLHERRYVFDEREADAQVIIPGDAFASDLFFRVTLPRDDEDAMPPEGDAEPLSPEQIALLEQWINEGAVWSDEPAVEPVASAPAPEQAPEPEFVFDDEAKAVQATAIARLRERGAVASPLSVSDPWVQVRFDLIGAQVTDQDVALLAGLEPTLVSLNLAGTSITDAGLAALGSFPRLERLHLARTGVTDAGLVHLSGLGELSYLNLYGTAVSDVGLASLAGLPNLTRLYVWDTRVSPQAGALLAALKPGLAVETSGELRPAFPEEGTGLAAQPPETPTPALQTGAGAPPPDAAALPVCCEEALARGEECDHPCCIEARLAGGVCEACSGE